MKIKRTFPNGKDIVSETLTFSVNSLEFIEGRRNSDSTILCGFALYLGVESVDELETAIEQVTGIDVDRKSTRLNSSHRT